MPKIQKNVLLGLEFLLLCIAVPGVIIAFSYAPFMMVFLWSAAAYCAVIYKFKFFENWKILWHWDAVNWQNLKPILGRWVIACAAMLVFTWAYDPSKLFNIWYRNPAFLPVLFLLYPVLSALPQEFIFCSFFFKRYKAFFGEGKGMILASALVFAYAHVLYINPVAPVVSFIGGIIFAQTFMKTKSLALVTIEHGLYGNALFLVGLGYYFYSGAVVTH